MPVITCVALGVVYALARFFVSGNLGEAASSGVFLAICCAVISHKNRIHHLHEQKRVFSPSLRPWLSLIATFGIIAMGVMRHTATVEMAVLDGFFAFAFFTAFASIFGRRRDTPSNPEK
jgi:hypothetical protein